MHKWQLFQKSLTCIVTRTSQRNHITSVLFELHWLPVRTCIMFKISTFVFQIKFTCQPSHLADRMKDYKPLHKLRSASKFLLTEPVFTTEKTLKVHFIILLLELLTVYRIILGLWRLLVQSERNSKHIYSDCLTVPRCFPDSVPMNSHYSYVWLT